MAPGGVGRAPGADAPAIRRIHHRILLVSTFGSLLSPPMLRHYHRWWSPSLHRDMELLVFGHHGARVLVFPTSLAHFYEWEDRGLIGALHEHLERGWLQLFCVDTVDRESWYNWGAHPADR